MVGDVAHTLTQLSWDKRMEVGPPDRMAPSAVENSLGVGSYR